MCYYTNLVPYSELLNIFETPSISKRHQIIGLLLLHKLVRGEVDDSGLLSWLNFAVPRLTSRSDNLFSPGFSRTNMGYFSPINDLCRLYNLHASEIDLFNDSVNVFRVKITAIIDN